MGTWGPELQLGGKKEGCFVPGLLQREPCERNIFPQPLLGCSGGMWPIANIWQHLGKSLVGLQVLESLGA